VLTYLLSRNRISNDPQNTTWANNTDRFGHKILRSQGWTPGATLGAKDASHASHYTAASASHIRVLLKDDTLGLGAKRGSERAENFGLAGLESILGRLNGREADVKKEEERRVEVERRGWVARKYGFMNFVSGGFLVGDKIEKKADVKVEVKEEVKEVKIKVEEESDSGEKKSKKRKRDREADGEVKQEDAGEQPSLKRKRKSGNLRDEAAEKEEEGRKSKKEKEKKKSKKSESASMEPSDSPAATSEEPLSDKAKRKAEKRARKEERKLKKALKKAAKEAARSNKEAESDSSSSEDEETETPTTTSAPTTGTSTPVGLAFGSGARHAVRARYIRQKKMASMDPQALKEVCYPLLELSIIRMLMNVDFHDKDSSLVLLPQSWFILCIAWRSRFPSPRPIYPHWLFRVMATNDVLGNRTLCHVVLTH
jgi:Pin2-interacting protein X1